MKSWPSSAAHSAARIRVRVTSCPLAWRGLARDAWIAHAHHVQPVPITQPSAALSSPPVLGYVELTIWLAGVGGVLAAAEEALLAGCHKMVGINLQRLRAPHYSIKQQAAFSPQRTDQRVQS